MITQVWMMSISFETLILEITPKSLDFQFCCLLACLLLSVRPIPSEGRLCCVM